MSDETSFGPAGIAIVVLVAAMLGAGWWWYGRDAQLPENRAEVTADPPAESDDGAPRYPLRSPLPEREDIGELEPLPDLDDSDRYFELGLADILGSGVTDLLVDESLIRNFVATIDNLPRASVAERIRPVAGLGDPFIADGQDGSDEFLLSPLSYDRHTPFAMLLARADRDALVDHYRRFYPLFQEAYANLGYPNRYFNDRLVEVIDHLVATPEPEPPVRLVRPNVLYEFADPELEALSAGQKLLIRAGPDNAVHIKQFLVDIRERVTALPE